ncbi:OB-fold domain-containing protein [Sporichthya brevicatena]|uniref:OB-fold domain-containing protein n=1 Tax=Sporichthya brevicatena TaxID=171442 RepID=A0ABN1G3X5_9ACTN
MPAETAQPHKDHKAVPKPTPETKPFWDACAEGELRLQYCTACEGHYFPPRFFCPTCLSRDVEWRAVSGRGRLYSYVINQSFAPPGWETPYAIALVELEEGPRLMSNILDVPQTPEALVLDMELEVTFEVRGGVAIPQFRPVAGGAA